MDESIKFGNPPSIVGDSAFAAMGRYLAAKKDGIAPDPEDWEEIKESVDENAALALAEPSDKIYNEYAKVYKGFLQEICHKTFDHAMEEDDEKAIEIASILRYEIDRALRQGKPASKGQLKDVLTKSEDWFNLPINHTTVHALGSWLKGFVKAANKAKKKQEKLKAAALELVATVQADQDSNAMRRLILKEMATQGRINEDQMIELCDRLMLNDEVEV
jgi:hypothetical protein